MIDFFNSLSTAEHTFFMIAIPSTIFFAMQVIATFFIGDFDGGSDVDVGSDGDLGVPFEMFTLRNLIGFLTVFSWTGIICLGNSFSLTTAIIVSTLAGLAMVVVTSSLFYFMSKLAQNNDITQSTAIGREGIVYLTIPAMGTGKINVKFGGAIRNVTATSNVDILTGTRVKVTGEKAGILVVEPLTMEA